MNQSNKNVQKKLEAQMLAINTVLREIYTNKSTDEYKMRGDITKSPSHTNIERMVSDLDRLKGFSKVDAADIKQLFETLHRPVFKNVVKEYMMEPNDRNTVFTAMFTVGYRILVGELSRIYSSTEATSKGIVYKPDKISRNNDASKLIRVFNSNLEQKLDGYVRDIKKHPGSAPVNEAYLTEVLASAGLIQEGFFDKFRRKKTYSVDDFNYTADVVLHNVRYLYQCKTEELEKAINDGDLSGQCTVPGVSDTVFRVGKRFTFNEMEAELEYRAVVPIYELKVEHAPGSADNVTSMLVYNASDEDFVIQILPSKSSRRGEEKWHSIGKTWDDVKSKFNDGESEDKSAEQEPKDVSVDDMKNEEPEQVQESMAGIMATVGTVGPLVTRAVGALGGLFKGAVSVLRGFNPIADINYLFMNSYEKKIAKFNRVSAMYESTKKAYDEYMKLPAGQRSKQVESKYVQNIEKYNISMKNLSAEIEHFNQRALKESKDTVDEVERKIPSTTPTSGNSGESNSNNDDDDFQF